jgi:signal transduction histidine kinase
MHVSYDSRPHRFTEDELNVLKMLADGAAIALANARLYSELQDHAHALAEALAQREELVRLKSEFIQNVSHELRTPLAIARGYIDLLDSGDLGELKDDQRDVIAILSRRVQMLTRMVDDLTAVLEAERTDVVREPVDLTEVVQRLMVDFAGSAYQAGLTLATDIQPNLPPVIGNPTHIQRVLDNLVGNALKFTPRGGVITIRLCFEGYYNLMEVSDTGIGIPKDQLSRVFDRFYQVDGSTTRRFGGTGLGLALVREIVETHRGTVSVSSEVGKGTKFQVRLPVKNV